MIFHIFLEGTRRRQRSETFWLSYYPLVLAYQLTAIHVTRGLLSCVQSIRNAAVGRQVSIRPSCCFIRFVALRTLAGMEKSDLVGKEHSFEEMCEQMYTTSLKSILTSVGEI